MFKCLQCYQTKLQAKQQQKQSDILTQVHKSTIVCSERALHKRLRQIFTYHHHQSEFFIHVKQIFSFFTVVNSL